MKVIYALLAIAAAMGVTLLAAAYPEALASLAALPALAVGAVPIAGLGGRLPRDPWLLRNVGQLRVRVKVRPSNGVTVLGRRWPAGTSIQMIYEDQLEGATDTGDGQNHGPVAPLVMSAEDEEILRAARISFEAQRKAWLRDNRSRKEDEFSLLTGISTESEFFKMAQRGIPPIESLEVLDRLPPPEMPENAVDRSAETIARALGKFVGRDRDRGDEPTVRRPAEAGRAPEESPPTRTRKTKR